ncbi:transposase, partial [Aquabacterium sp.]|uniref:transposase n=1 Tax=Aquabacterium sp. TaxID=1872578 RepID=UPI003D6C7BF8
MEVQFTDLVPSLQTLFSTDADLAALQACLIRRRRKITGAAFAQGLVFGWLQNPDATSADLTASLARAGAAIKPQSLDGRFTPQAAGFFRLLLDKALAKVLAPPSRALGLLARFKGVYLIDGTTIPLPAVLAEAWPGCGGTAAAVAGKASLKAVVRYEVSGGAITGLSLHAGKTSDVGTPPHRAPLPPRSLRLADLGFFGLDDLAGVDEQDAYYLTRIKSICMVYDQQGRKCKLARYLARQKGDRLDRCLWLGEGKRLKGRLLAIRTPEAVAAKRRCEAKEEAQRHGRQVSEETLALCGWTVFFTNVPRGVLSLQEA